MLNSIDLAAFESKVVLHMGPGVQQGKTQALRDLAKEYNTMFTPLPLPKRSKLQKLIDFGEFYGGYSSFRKTQPLMYPFSNKYLKEQLDNCKSRQEQHNFDKALSFVMDRPTAMKILRLDPYAVLKGVING